MNFIQYVILFATPVVIAFSGCAHESGAEGWTENQEIHFLSDCTSKMDQNEFQGNIHDFCVCCLQELEQLYPNGKDAVENLTDQEIGDIESKCFDR